jgi:site-specific DNA-methyltransferase (adenine-specific)
MPRKLMVGFSTGGQTLLKGDFLTLDDPALPPEGFPLIVTSPPYDLGKAYEGKKDESAHATFTLRWLERAYNLAAPNGRLCLNLPLDTSLGDENHPAYASALQIARGVGWRYKTTIVWNEGNISRRTAWGSWRSASAPHIIAPVEMIAVLYKGEWLRGMNGHGQHIPAEDFKNWTNGLWTFNGESAKRVQHPAPFPVELPRRCIEMFSFPGEDVLDPFSGSGTTAIAARRAGRMSVGVERDRTYFLRSVARLRAEIQSP